MDLAAYDDKIVLPQDLKLLARYRQASAGGLLPHIRLLDGEVMAEVGDDLTVVEPTADGEFDYLFYGRAVFAVNGCNYSGKSTAQQSPRSGAQSRHGFARALAAGQPVYTLDRAAENGSVHLWGRLHLPFQDSSGRPVVVTINRPQEYTDELLRDILDAAADGILAVRAIRDATRAITDFDIIAVNTTMAEFLQIDRNAVASQTILQLLPCVTRDGAWEKHVSVVESRAPTSFESRYVLKGGVRWYRIVSAPLNDGLVVSYTDITELKVLNLKLEEQRRKLEEEVARRLKMEEELWTLAHCDALTGIANRRAMHLRATKMLEEARLSGAPCAMIVLDIDHFKGINDTHGHAAGDAAIIRVAEIARSGLRDQKDIAARMGGEEFAMLLNAADIGVGLAVAERLRKEIETTVITCEGKSFGLTVSFGVAASAGGCTYESLIQTADKALYRAKRAGRNQSSAEPVSAAA